jgi:hypothetical protein
VSGFLSLQSGLAMSPGISLSTAGLATRPNATGASISAAGTRFQWFNPAAFAAPAAGFYGNAGTGVIRGPGFAIWDSSATKQFPIREKLRLRFAAEFFNFMNHTNWSGVGTSLGAGNYAQITSARDPRKIQLSLRLNY